MNGKRYFHLCADGVKARNFIQGKKDFIAAMNIIALCAANSGAVVVSFSLEDTHPHFLLYGTLAECSDFARMFETVYGHYAASTRSGGADLAMEIELYPADTDEQHLMKVAAYTIIQPTKDGKRVMPYDYPWGTASLYFRTEGYIPVLMRDGRGGVFSPVTFGSMGYMQRRGILHSRKYSIPGSWLVCNGVILPDNYVDAARFESIFKTHNCFRVFQAGSKAMEKEILLHIAAVRGVAIEDSQARRLCGDECLRLFGFRDPRRLESLDKIRLAQNLRTAHRLTFRQLSTLVRLPEYELRRYVP